LFLNDTRTDPFTATSTNTYQWDAANRLVSITGQTNQSLFTYDGLGHRVQIVELTNGVAYATNKFVWCGTELCEQRDLTGATVTKRFFGGGEQISGANYYFTRDHLGSVREVANSAGVMQARYDYDPYGRQTVVAGSFQADFGYAGMYYHAASGLNLTLYWAYDSDLGRWNSRDPLAEQAGLNLYAYVENNPIIAIDPDGRSEIFIIGGIILASVVGIGLYVIWYNAAHQSNQTAQDAADAGDYTRADAIRNGTIQQIVPQAAKGLDQTQNPDIIDTIMKHVVDLWPERNPHNGHWITETIWTWKCGSSEIVTSHPGSPGSGWQLVGTQQINTYTDQ